MEELSSKTANEKITVKATLKGERFTEADIVTEIEFPSLDSGVVGITCAFEDDVIPLRLGFQFELQADVDDVEGKKIGGLRAKKVFWRKGTKKLGREIWRGEALDLTYTQLVGEDPSEKPRFITSFYLTPSDLLQPFQSTVQHYQQGFKVRTHRAAKFKIKGVPKARFESHLVYEKEPNRSFSARQRLAAVCESKSAGDIKKQVHALEIFLTLVSFAERRRIACYAVTQYSPGKIVKHYRGNITIPDPAPSHGHNDTLIGPEKFNTFMTDCYPRLLKSRYGAYLRQAMLKLNSDSGRTLESAFIAQFAGLENLLNAYAKGKSGILPAHKWKPFNAQLREFIKGHASFKADKTKRELLYNKLGELNRPALSAVLKAFVTKEKINLDSLWPVTEPPGDSVSLYQIRNQIVHGRILPHSGYRALMVAQFHLQWVLERCLLGVLTWDIEQSRVSDRFLQMVGPVAWTDESKLLKTAFASAEGEANLPTPLFNPD